MYMLRTLLRNVVRAPSTRLYPIEKREPFERFRGALLCNIEACIFCKICEKKCPSHCISVKAEEGLWECESFACVQCAACVEACPKKCLKLDNKARPPATERETVRLVGTPRVKKAAKTDVSAD